MAYTERVGMGQGGTRVDGGSQKSLPRGGKARACRHQRTQGGGTGGSECRFWSQTLWVQSLPVVCELRDFGQVIRPSRPVSSIK